MPPRSIDQRVPKDTTIEHRPLAKRAQTKPKISNHFFFQQTESLKPKNRSKFFSTQPEKFFRPTFFVRFLFSFFLFSFFFFGTKFQKSYYYLLYIYYIGRIVTFLVTNRHYFVDESSLFPK